MENFSVYHVYCLEKAGILASEVQNMQNNPEKKSHGVKQFLKDKGYYIVLFLCVAAVGVSGYLFVRTAADQNRADFTEESTLSVPLTTPDAESKAPKEESKPSTATISELPEDTAETAVPTEETETVPTSVTTMRPLEGDTIGAYSMDALAYNETTRDWRTHNGIDIAASTGDPVVAARDGTVSAIYDDNAFGTTVVVNHDDGYVTHYANLSEETAVSVGQAVKAGDVLGTVGDSATVELAQDSHLHFAVYLDNQPMDPEAFLNS